MIPAPVPTTSYIPAPAPAPAPAPSSGRSVVDNPLTPQINYGQLPPAPTNFQVPTNILTVSNSSDQFTLPNNISTQILPPPVAPPSGYTIPPNPTTESPYYNDPVTGRAEINTDALPEELLRYLRPKTRILARDKSEINKRSKEKYSRFKFLEGCVENVDYTKALDPIGRTFVSVPVGYDTFLTFYNGYNCPLVKRFNPRVIIEPDFFERMHIYKGREYKIDFLMPILRPHKSNLDLYKKNVWECFDYIRFCQLHNTYNGLNREKFLRYLEEEETLERERERYELLFSNTYYFTKEEIKRDIELLVDEWLRKRDNRRKLVVLLEDGDGEDNRDGTVEDLCDRYYYYECVKYMLPEHTLIIGSDPDFKVSEAEIEKEHSIEVLHLADWSLYGVSMEKHFDTFVANLARHYNFVRNDTNGKVKIILKDNIVPGLTIIPNSNYLIQEQIKYTTIKMTSIVSIRGDSVDFLFPNRIERYEVHYVPFFHKFINDKDKRGSIIQNFSSDYWGIEAVILDYANPPDFDDFYQRVRDVPVNAQRPCRLEMEQEMLEEEYSQIQEVQEALREASRSNSRVPSRSGSLERLT